MTPAGYRYAVTIEETSKIGAYSALFGDLKNAAFFCKMMNATKPEGARSWVYLPAQRRCIQVD